MGKQTYPHGDLRCQINERVDRDKRKNLGNTTGEDHHQDHRDCTPKRHQNKDRAIQDQGRLQKTELLIECKYCSHVFVSSRDLNWHVKVDHKLNITSGMSFVRKISTPKMYKNQYDKVTDHFNYSP